MRVAKARLEPTSIWALAICDCKRNCVSGKQTVTTTNLSQVHGFLDGANGYQTVHTYITLLTNAVSTILGLQGIGISEKQNNL
jgi:hypothetical protein